MQQQTEQHRRMKYSTLRSATSKLQNRNSAVSKSATSNSAASHRATLIKCVIEKSSIK